MYVTNLLLRTVTYSDRAGTNDPFGANCARLAQTDLQLAGNYVPLDGARYSQDTEDTEYGCGLRPKGTLGLHEHTSRYKPLAAMNWMQLSRPISTANLLPSCLHLNRSKKARVYYYP